MLGTAIQVYNYQSQKKSDIALYLSNKQLYKETLSKQKIETQQHIEMLHIEINQISRKLIEIDQNASDLRKEKKLIKNELLSHYSELLKNGTDTRTEGLS